jgi:hypothetical protein
MHSTTKRSANPRVGEPCDNETPAFANYFHAQNHLWLRAQGTAQQVEGSTSVPCRLTCASSAFTLADVVARMADPDSELRHSAITLRDRMAAIVVELTDH